MGGIFVNDKFRIKEAWSDSTMAVYSVFATSGRRVFVNEKIIYSGVGLLRM